MDRESFLINQFHSNSIGDDGAVIGDMVYSVDAFFEDVHFRREWMSMEQIARKAMLVNLSDAIAMNATPIYALVSISIPKDLSNDAIKALTQSLELTAAEYECEIIGGDTIGASKLHISITLISKSINPLLRRGLKEGDMLAYTGRLGESKRDLDRLISGEKIANDSRFYEPSLRGAFITQARAYLNAGMDISDGLYCDTNKLLDCNHLGFETIVDISDEIGMSGEEYEMLIGFDPKYREDIEQVAKKCNTPLTIFATTSYNKKRYGCQSHHFK